MAIIRVVGKIDALTIVACATKTHVETLLVLIYVFWWHRLRSVEQKFNYLSGCLLRILSGHQSKFHVESLLHTLIV